MLAKKHMLFSPKWVEMVVSVATIPGGSHRCRQFQTSCQRVHYGTGMQALALQVGSAEDVDVELPRGQGALRGLPLGRSRALLKLCLWTMWAKRQGQTNRLRR